MAWDQRHYYRDEPPRFKIAVPMPGRMTIAVMVACLVVFFLLNVFGIRWIGDWGVLTFIDHLALRQPWRWLTYAYLHGSGRHIFWNLLGIYFFLTPLERAWGPKRAFIFYTLGTLVAAITFSILCLFMPNLGLVGASGGVLATLGACAYLFPDMMLFMIIPIRIAAALFGILYLLSIAGDKNPSDAAHLGGLVFGFFGPYYGRHVWSRTWQRVDHKRRVSQIATEAREQKRIDAILQKVHDSGMNSLSWSERRALKKATERQRRAEMARARRAG